MVKEVKVKLRLKGKEKQLRALNSDTGEGVWCREFSSSLQN